MNPPALAAPPPDVALPADAARQVDLLCDEFEQQWRQGLRPRIEDYLIRGPVSASAILCEELLAVELECRWQAGEAPRPEEYASRLTVPAARIVRLLEELAGPSELDADRAGDISSYQPPETVDEPRPASTPEAAAGLPRLFGEYELLEKLGEGGMGSVYKARHRRLGRMVAVKLVRADLRGREESLARFQREMQAAGRLEHPHLVETQHAGEHEGVLYLVMKLVEGTDLARLVRRLGPLRAADACELIRQAALGLEHVHECSLVHRDIKPSNIMLTAEGTVKVLDLGLARLGLESAAESTALTHHGDLMGTPDYMAPEQAQHSHTADIRADLYSLGCTLYFLLAGRPPFADYGNVMEKLLAHQQAAPPSLSNYRPDLPAELVTLVARLLAKRPQERFARPYELALALAPLAVGADLSALLRAAEAPGAPPARVAATFGAAPARTDRPMAPKPRRPRRRLLVAGLGAAAVLILGLAVFATQPWRSAGDVGETPGSKALTVRSLRVFLWDATDKGGVNEAGWLGERGDLMFTRFDDQVKVTAELSAPAYFYLIAFNTNGKEQPYWPTDDKQPPPQQQRVTREAVDAFTLDDGEGIQAFILVASRRPLPAYADWKASRPALRWQPQPIGKVIWRGDDKGVCPLTPGDQRGTVQPSLRGEPPLKTLCQQLRALPGIEAVSGIAFPVLPKQ
jgi:tRNA A-37 threonylcarbamoyl transferase component Bud32